MTADFTEYVRLTNKAAHLNKFDDEGARWRSWYESDSFEKNMEVGVPNYWFQLYNENYIITSIGTKMCIVLRMSSYYITVLRNNDNICI